MGQLGVQLTPSADSRQLVGLARRLSGVAVLSLLGLQGERLHVRAAPPRERAI